LTNIKSVRDVVIQSRERAGERLDRMFGLDGAMGEPMRRTATLFFAAFAVLIAGPATAAQPRPWEVTLQPAATDVMASVTWFANYTVIIVGLITIFVLALILYCVWKFNERAHPTPDTTSHNTLIEVAWTVVPVLILVAIAVPSFQLLYFQEDIPEADLTVKATGQQWYWTYQYPDEGYENIELTSVMLEEDQRSGVMSDHGLGVSQVPRLLAVNYDVVVPVDKIVRVEVTSGDVNHAFAIPAFGIKVDAIPGRLNQTWFKAERTGTYFGQCSELCGTRHAFMPIAFQVVTEERFEEWAKAAAEDPAKAQALVYEWMKADAGDVVAAAASAAR
jgi:cytochrome c oxidase subunit 2